MSDTIRCLCAKCHAFTEHTIPAGKCTVCDASLPTAKGFSMTTAFLNDGIMINPGTDPGSIVLSDQGPDCLAIITPDGICELIKFLRQHDLMPCEDCEVVVTGDPIDGFNFYGPFFNGEGQTYVDRQRDPDVWVAPQTNPD